MCLLVGRFSPFTVPVHPCYTVVTFHSLSVCLSSRIRRFGGDGQRFGDREGYRGGPGGYGGAPGAEGKEGAPGVYRPAFREVGGEAQWDVCEKKRYLVD